MQTTFTHPKLAFSGKCSPFVREVWQKIAAQTTQTDMELGALSFKEFHKHRIFMIWSLKGMKSLLRLSLYWYLCQGQQAENDLHLRKKIDPKIKNNKGNLCMSQNRLIERCEKRDWVSNTERFQLPVIYREAQKHKQSPNLKGLVGIFHTWKWTGDEQITI